MNVPPCSPIHQTRLATYVDPSDPSSTAAREIASGRTPATVARFGDQSFVLATVVPVVQLVPTVVDRPLGCGKVIF